MIRASLGNRTYWNKWTTFDKQRALKEWERLSDASKNRRYRPQFAFDTAQGHMKAMLRGYSGGTPVGQLNEFFGGLLDAWELSNRLAEEVCSAENLKTCRDWTFELSNLNHYNWCFWLAGLALALEIPDEQWRRLLVLINAEGEDELLDRVIATRQPDRKIGTALLHPKPYARLLAAVDASPADQASLLSEFVAHWYSELARAGKDELWWYIYGDPMKHPLEMGSYFGRWCIEAVAAVKAFNLDDSLCLGHEHYPGDLLRPDGPTTHRKPEDASRLRGLGSKLLNMLGR